MTFRTLISTDALAAHLSEPSLIVVDCRFRLDDVRWGRREYEHAHVPGASYADIEADLSGPKTGSNGRHPLPDPLVLATLFGRLGISNGVQVVAYDQDSGSFASRLWWLLRWLGHDDVAVLDGGFTKWTAEGLPLASGVEGSRARRFEGTPRMEMIASADQVASRIGRSDWRLLDARVPERFSGKIEPIDKVAGHIPSAVNHSFQRNVDQSGLFQDPDRLREQFAASIGAVSPDHVICYCGSGVTACHNLLALEHAGLLGAQLYPGSWSEWSSDPSRPVEK